MIIQDNLREFERAYRKAKGSMKKRLLRKLLKQVVLSPEGLHIFMQLADGIEIPNHQIKLIRFEGSKDEKNPQYALTRKASGDGSNLQIFNSVIGKFGDAGMTRTFDLLLRRHEVWDIQVGGDHR